MEYGIMIRKAREALGLYLKDLSEQNLSFNLLSNIEKGKTKLTKQKALMLYKRILEYSWAKNIFPYIEFDELLKEEEKYLALKNAHESCKVLKSRVDGKIFISKSEYREFNSLASNDNIGDLSYVMYSLIVELIPELWSRDKLNTYHNILDYLKWSNLCGNLDKYKLNLERSLQYSLRENKINQSIDYSNVLLEAEEKYCYSVDTNIYFNLVILHKKERDYEKSLYFLNKYIESKSHFSFAEDAEIKILQASLLSDTGEIEKALEIYLITAKGLSGEGHEFLEALCYGNSIYRIYKHKLKNKMPVIREYINKIENLMSGLKNQNSNHSLYSNIALGYFLIGDHLTAKKNVLIALERASSNKNNLIVLEEALELFVVLNELDFIVEKLCKLELDFLEPKDLKLLYEMLIKILLLNSQGKAHVDLGKIEEIFKKVSIK